MSCDLQTTCARTYLTDMDTDMDPTGGAHDAPQTP